MDMRVVPGNLDFVTNRMVKLDRRGRSSAEITVGRNIVVVNQRRVGRLRKQGLNLCSDGILPVYRNNVSGERISDQISVHQPSRVWIEDLVLEQGRTTRIGRRQRTS